MLCPRGWLRRVPQVPVPICTGVTHCYKDADVRLVVEGAAYEAAGLLFLPPRDNSELLAPPEAAAEAPFTLEVPA